MSILKSKTLTWDDFEPVNKHENLIKNGWDDFEKFGSGKNYVKDSTSEGRRFDLVETIPKDTEVYIIFKGDRNDRGYFTLSDQTGKWNGEMWFGSSTTHIEDLYIRKHRMRRDVEHLNVVGANAKEFYICRADDPILYIEKTPLGNGLTRIQTWGGNRMQKIGFPVRVFDDGEKHVISMYVKNNGDRFRLTNNLKVGAWIEKDFEGFYTLKGEGNGKTHITVYVDTATNNNLDFIASDPQLIEGREGNPMKIIEGSKVKIYGPINSRVEAQTFKGASKSKIVSSEVEVEQGEFEIGDGHSVGTKIEYVRAPYKGELNLVHDKSMEKIYIEKTTPEPLILTSEGILVKEYRDVKPKFEVTIPKERDLVDRGWDKFTHFEGEGNIIKNGWESYEPYGSGENYVENWNFEGDMSKWSNYEKTKENTVKVEYGWQCRQNKDLPKGDYVVRVKFKVLKKEGEKEGQDVRVAYGASGKHFDVRMSAGEDKGYVVRSEEVTLNQDISGDEGDNRLYVLGMPGTTVEVDWIQITPIDNQHLVVEKTPLGNGLTRIQTWGGRASMKLIARLGGITDGEFSYHLFIENLNDKEIIIDPNTYGEQVYIKPYEMKKVKTSGERSSPIAAFQSKIRTQNKNDNLDFIAGEPTLFEVKEYDREKEVKNLIKNGWEDFEPYRVGKNYVKEFDKQYYGNKQQLAYIDLANFEEVNVGDTLVLRMKVRFGEGREELRIFTSVPTVQEGRAFKVEHYDEKTSVLEYEFDLKNDSGKVNQILINQVPTNLESFSEIKWVSLSKKDDQHLVVEKTPLGNGLTRIQTWGGNHELKLRSPRFKQGLKPMFSTYIEDTRYRFAFQSSWRYSDIVWVEANQKGVIKYKTTDEGEDSVFVRAANVDYNLDFIASDPQIVEGDNSIPTVHKHYIGKGLYKIRSERGSLINKWEWREEDLEKGRYTVAQYIENKGVLPLRVKANEEVEEVKGGEKEFIKLTVDTDSALHFSYDSYGSDINFIASEPVITKGEEPYPYKVEDITDDKERYVKVHGITPRTRIAYKGPETFINEDYALYTKINNKGVEMEMDTSISNTKTEIPKGESELEVSGKADKNDFVIELGAKNG